MESRASSRQHCQRKESWPKARLSIIPIPELGALIAQVQADLTGGVIERVTVSWPDVFATAEALSAAHGVGTLCRTLDILHVAPALELGATELCTFDLRQSRMTAAAGLAVNARNVAMKHLTR